MTKHGKNRPAGNSSSHTGATLLTEQSPAERDELISTDEQIRVRAYELYRARGDTPGDDMRDWLEAEREYREQS